MRGVNGRRQRSKGEIEVYQAQSSLPILGQASQHEQEKVNEQS